MLSIKAGIAIFLSVVAQPQPVQNIYPMDLSVQNFSLPRTVDKKLAEVLSSKDTVFYKTPKFYQYYYNGLFGVYEAHYLKDFNANLDFPWETTFGLNGRDKVYTSVNFCYLPRENNKIKPIVILDYERPIRWIFPEGAVLGEILLQPHPNGGRVIFEIRIRTKTSNTWEVAIFRPIATQEEFQEKLNIAAYTPATKFFMMQNPEKDKVFVVSGKVEVVPEMSVEQVDYALSLPFKDVTDSGWTPAGNQWYCLFPRDYKLGLISADSLSCQSCHKQTQVTVDRLIPSEPNIRNNLEKVGSIRGSDGIFTYSPFGSINNGSFTYRDYDLRNGRIAFYSKEKYPEYKIAYFVDKGQSNRDSMLWKEYGFTGKEKYSPISNTVGLYVTAVKSRSTAMANGIRPGDIIYFARAIQPRDNLTRRGIYLRNAKELEFMLVKHKDNPVECLFVRGNTKSKYVFYPKNYTFDNTTGGVTY